MKANYDMKTKLPLWGTVALAAVLVATIAGSGGSASASNGGRSSGRAGADSPAVGTQYFQDVPPDSPFFTFIGRIYTEGLVNGYACGGQNEPCGPGNLPYYRTGVSMTRGQMAKIISSSQDITVHDLTVPFRIVNTTSASVGIWGGNSGAGPSHDPTEVNAGLYGDATGTSNSVGLLAVADHDNAAMLVSNSTGAGASYSLNIPHNGADIEQGGTGPADALHVGGHITVTGGCTGCTADQVMMNTGTTDLHPGDVVVLGATAPQGTTVNGTAVAGVSTSGATYNTAVVGVVSALYIKGDPSAPDGTAQRTGGRDDTATAIKPGELMTVVTEGTYNLVKVDAGKDGIRAGDLLTTGSTAGAAMKATDKLASVGAILGKALGNLDSGTGYIPVLVTLK